MYKPRVNIENAIKASYPFCLLVFLTQLKIILSEYAEH